MQIELSGKDLSLIKLYKFNSILEEPFYLLISDFLILEEAEGTLSYISSSVWAQFQSLSPHCTCGYNI